MAISTARPQAVVHTGYSSDPTIDVFDTEPLSPSHPFRTLDNVVATPHIGCASQGLYRTFYEDTVSNIRKWLDTH
jgi:phosphoglycerate dehydrogenase-like enzyme